jgi:hypothetical protein
LEHFLGGPGFSALSSKEYSVQLSETFKGP